MLRACTLALCSVLVVGCGSKDVETYAGEPVVLAVIAPFKGVNALKGREAFTGIDMELSAAPALRNGRPIRVLYEHSAHNEAEAVAALRKLAANRRVVAVISFLNSDAMLAMSPEAEKLGLPVLVGTATHPEVIEGSRYISQLIFDDRFQGEVAALFTRDELLFDSAAVFSNPRSSASRFLGEEFARKFTAVGGDIVDSISAYGRAFNLEAALRKLQRQDPQLLYVTLEAHRVAEMARILVELKWRPRILVPEGVLLVLIREYQKSLRQLDGVIGTDVFSPKEIVKQGGQFSRRYGLIRNTRPDQVNTYSVLGIESMLLMREAMNRCIDIGIDRQCMRDRIRKTRNLIGVIGPIDITDEGRAVRPLVINEIRQGKIQYLVRVH